MLTLDALERSDIDTISTTTIRACLEGAIDKIVAKQSGVVPTALAATRYSLDDDITNVSWLNQMDDDFISYD